MGAFSNMDYELQNSGAAVSDAFTEDDDMDMPQAAPVESMTASSPAAVPTPAAVASEPVTAPNTQSEDEARRAHEAAEAKRKAEWDAKQAEKRRAEQAMLERLDAMGPAELLKAAAKRVSADTEKLTRRNMKESVAEFIQTKCIDDLGFARLTMHPRKSMIHCFQYISRKAWDYVQDELKANGFRWAPSVGAWQRQLNKNAYYAAGYISCIQPISGEKPIDVQRSAQQQESAAPDAHLTGKRVSTPRGSFHVADMTREQMEAAGYGYHHSTDDGKYLIMGNGTQAFAIAAEQREQENYMRTAELSTEQNYNMIDGQINNIPSVDELEEKAKRGKVISLSALAAAVKAEDGRTPQRDPDGKKPSIRAQLKADRAQSCKPQQREKEQEAKRSIRQALEME